MSIHLRPYQNHFHGPNRSAYIFSGKNAKWRGNPASDKQLAILKKKKIPHKQEITSGEASTMLSEYFQKRDIWKKEKATSAQIYLLKMNGIDVSPELTKGEAMKLLRKYHI
jgi:hypothetical protein